VFSRETGDVTPGDGISKVSTH